MALYTLSATLEGHTQDVKSIASPFNDTIVSVSRDQTVRVWTNDRGHWSSNISYHSSRYLNSIAFDLKNQLVVSGGQDSLVNVTDLYASGIDAKYVLIGHSSNVCSLDVGGDEIISGSWDSTAKVWENFNLKYTLEGHNASVWAVKIISPGKYITASADGTIKIWEQDKVVKTIVGHQDVIRGLALLPNSKGFVSVSNDTTGRITDFDGNLIQELQGHESFVYSVAILSNGHIVTSGEDRTVRIWDPATGEAIQVITLPSISVWSISILPNDDIVAGGSDNIIRVFTRENERFASKEDLKLFKESVEQIAVNSQTIDESQIKSPEDLSSPGSKEGQVIIVKSNTGINEAFQWSENKWNKVGEVVSGAGSSNQKVEFDGGKWDFVFDVDVKDGEPPLKLPYNVTENPFLAATRFLEKYELPSSYTDEVVRFITQNTGGVDISQSSDVTNPYVESRKKLVPQAEYLGFINDNFSTILTGLKKLNQDTFTNFEIERIEDAYKKNDYPDLLESANRIIESATWRNKLPAFDLLRLIVYHLDKPPKELGNVLKFGLVKDAPTNYFMTLRFLSNIFLNKKWGESIITDSSISTRILNLVDILDDVNGKQALNISNAISTLILNFSVYANKFKVSPLAIKVNDVLNSKGKSIAASSSEAAYRLAVAYGTLINFNEDFKNAQYNEFKQKINETYKEARFVEVFEDINSL